MAYIFGGGIPNDAMGSSVSDDIIGVAAGRSVFFRIPRDSYRILVSEDDRVDLGTRIAKSSKFELSGVYSSVSGRVEQIVDEGENVLIKIENDGFDRVSPLVRPFEGSPANAPREELLSAIRRAAIACRDGVMLHARLAAAMSPDAHLIINAAENEPGLRVRRSLLFRNLGGIVRGAEIIMRTLGVERADMAVSFCRGPLSKKLSDGEHIRDSIKVHFIPTEYPFDHPRLVAARILGVEIGPREEPEQRGIAVVGAEDCAAVYDAFCTGLPALNRTVSLVGDCIKRPCTVTVPIGTSFRDIADSCGGFFKKPHRIIDGSPMTGVATDSLDSFVSPSCVAMTVLSQKYDFAPSSENADGCLNCGKCADVCPVGIVPSLSVKFSGVTLSDEPAPVPERKLSGRGKGYFMSSLACIECGCCSYVCPAEIPLTPLMKKAKSKAKGECPT